MRARRSLLLLAAAGFFTLAGCQNVYRVIDSNAAGGSTTAPVPVPVPTPALATLSPELNASSMFIGASIINRWPLPVHNGGIPGQTSSQVLQRFPIDVLHHGYARVIIQVGSNDILQQVKDPSSTVSSNLAFMGQEARAANIDVVVISLAPITWGGMNLDESSSAVNVKLHELATAQGYHYVDVFTPMQGHPEYFVDGLHPNVDGYAVIENALARVLK